jgi:hypothetical protein
MATKYADFDLATGNNDGSDWTNAWKTMADAIAGSNSAPPAAGDTVYCRGTDSTAGAITSTLAGNETNGLIKWIGVNASGNNDGTRATISGGGGNFNIFLLGGDYNYFENFRFTGSGNGCGVTNSGTHYLSAFVNCSFDTCGTYGVYASLLQYCWFIRCVAYGCGLQGFHINNNDICIFCCARDNTGGGFQKNTSGHGILLGCIAYDNGSAGYLDMNYVTIVNCVSDNNVVGIDIQSQAGTFNVLIGNRITNNSGVGNIGLDCNTEIVLYGWNAFDGNTDHIADSTLAIALTHNGTATNSELNENGAGGGDTLQGYVSTTEGSEDYSTNYVGATDPHLRRTAITIPTS